MPGRGSSPQGDQLGLGRGREAVEIGLARGRGELEHLQSVPPIGDIGEQGGIGAADDHILRIVELPAEIDLFVDHRPGSGWR